MRREEVIVKPGSGFRTRERLYSHEHTSQLAKWDGINGMPWVRMDPFTCEQMKT